MKSVSLEMGPVGSLPESDFAPVQLPVAGLAVARQVIALLVLQVSVVAVPVATWDAPVVRVMVGAGLGASTFTVMIRETLAAVFEQVSV
jgi:hypothetical protein